MQPCPARGGRSNRGPEVDQILPKCVVNKHLFDAYPPEPDVSAACGFRQDIHRQALNASIRAQEIVWRRVVRTDPVAQPGVSNLLAILAACGGRPAGEITSYGQLKREVTDAVEAVLSPIRARYAELSADPGYVDGVLTGSAARVRERAAGTVLRAKRAIGLLN